MSTDTGTQKRGVCPECGRDTALTAAGLIRHHGGAPGTGFMGSVRAYRCSGSGSPPQTAESTNQTVERAHVTLSEGWPGPEWRCEAGQVEHPIGCERHREHHWCATCVGFYGVPHDGIHEGRNAHPNTGDRNQCACRPCKMASGREAS